MNFSIHGFRMQKKKSRLKVLGQITIKNVQKTKDAWGIDMTKQLLRL
jgi:hypothetical protein